ncbi:MAG: hypothetical protein ACRC1K_02610 [Planctomycetia bacterium]
MWKSPILFVAACGALLGAGCGRGAHLVPVSGRVTIDGAPLSFGAVQFVPAEGRPAYGVLAPDGSFTLTTYEKDDGCRLGSHQIEVVASRSVGPSATLWGAPKDYAKVNTSGLTQELTGAAKNIEIKLAWNGGKMFVETNDGKKRDPKPTEMGVAPSVPDPKDPMLLIREGGPTAP